jgi:hypothetical protein
MSESELTEALLEQGDDGSDDSNDYLEAGDDCPEPHCGRELRELRHPRDSQLDTEPHPDAPEVEVVCVHDGIVATR